MFRHEAAVNDRLAAMPLDMPAMAAVSNLYPAAGAIRNHFEHTVLAPYNLTWTGWVVLWVVWIWEEIETRHVAAEAGISKGTLTGVAGALEKPGLIQRRAHPEDARRVLMVLTLPAPSSWPSSSRSSTTRKRTWWRRSAGTGTGRGGCAAQVVRRPGAGSGLSVPA